MSMPAKRIAPWKKAWVTAGKDTLVSMQRRFIYIDLMRPYNYCMDPPRVIPTNKFDPLMMVVIVEIKSVDSYMVSIVPRSVVIGGSSISNIGFPMKEKGEILS